MCVEPFILFRKGKRFSTTDTVPLDLHEVDIGSHKMSQRTKWHLNYPLIVFFVGLNGITGPYDREPATRQLEASAVASCGRED